MRLAAHGGTGPLPHPATQRQCSMGGRVGERAGAASEIALPRFPKQPSKRGAQGAAWPATWRSMKLSSGPATVIRKSEEHTSALQSLMRISYAVFCLKKKK